MRSFLLIASAIVAFAATMTIETTDANAVGLRPWCLSRRLRRLSGCGCRAPSPGRCRLPQGIGERCVGAPLRIAQATPDPISCRIMLADYLG